MRKFDIFYHENGDCKSVKRGWYWPAFFFGSIWSLFSGLWIIGILMLPVELILNMIGNIINKIPDHANDPIAPIASSIVLILFISIRLLFGFKGNGWRREKLYRNDFSLVYSTRAKNVESAIIKYNNDKKLLI